MLTLTERTLAFLSNLIKQNNLRLIYFHLEYERRTFIVP